MTYLKVWRGEGFVCCKKVRVCMCICGVLHARCHRPVPSKENDWLDLVSLSSTNHLTMTLTFLEHARALLVVPNFSVVVMHHVVNTPNRLFLTPRYIPNVHIISHPRCWCRCSLRSTAIPLQLPCGDWFVLLDKHYSKVLILAPFTELLAQMRNIECTPGITTCILPRLLTWD